MTMPRSSAAIIALPATSVDITGEAALRASEVRRDVVPIPVRLISERYSADMVIVATIALRGIDRAAAKYQRRLKADVALHRAGPVAKVTGGSLAPANSHGNAVEEAGAITKTNEKRWDKDVTSC